MSANNSIPRMRGIKQAIEEVKQADPESAVTVYWLRRAIKQGLVPCVFAGGKQLIPMSALYAYLENPTPPKPTHAPSGTIRMISAR